MKITGRWECSAIAWERRVTSDMRVFAEADPGLFISIARHAAGRFGDISAHDHETSEVSLVDLAKPETDLELVAARETGVQYDIDHHPSILGQPALIIRTNADGAEDFKIVWTPLNQLGRANWRDLIPHRPGVYILSYLVLQDWLIRLEREDGLPRIIVRRIDSGEEHVIAFAGRDLFARYRRRLRVRDQPVALRLFVDDHAVGGVGLRSCSRTRTLRKRQDVPSGHDMPHYVTRRLFAPAPDGETVPISLLHRKDLKLDGSDPCLLYGYGAYGISIPAAFSTNRLSLVDRGFVYAIAHVRGGSEKGWRWYREGKLAKEAEHVHDFIAVREHLGEDGWCAPDKIVAHGGSAGGTLIGAVANARPNLYAGLIAEVPFVDVLNTMLDETLPLTPPEWPEWGDPIRDPVAFKTILGYSPYENVTRAGLSGNSCAGGPDRPARALLGAGKMDRAAAPAAQGSQAYRVPHQPRRRTCGRRGPLRSSQGSSARLSPSRSRSRAKKLDVAQCGCAAR